MRNFDFYEFTGILIPGALILSILTFLLPGMPGILQGISSVSVGGLGVFVLVAYAAGHLVQGIGNLVEVVFWKVQGGMPTEWVRTAPEKLLSSAQVGRIKAKVGLLLSLDQEKEISSFSAREWFAITRQVYVAVLAAGKSQRIDVFNGNYGLLRGIASSLLVGLALLPFSTSQGWIPALVITASCAIAFMRMRRFGIHYGRELFVQFVDPSVVLGAAGGES